MKFGFVNHNSTQNYKKKLIVWQTYRKSLCMILKPQKQNQNFDRWAMIEGKNSDSKIMLHLYKFDWENENAESKIIDAVTKEQQKR